MNYVILAGGTGTRLWPVSRNSKPKQFSQIISTLTMFEETLKRLELNKDFSNLYVSTSERFAPIIKQIIPDLPADHLIVEPEKRDTGPAMAFVAGWLAQIAPNEPMAFIPSDHSIRDEKTFKTTFTAAEEMIKTTGKMLDISVIPTFAATTLGYTKIGKAIKHQDGIHFFEFLGHVEKPNYVTAKKYLATGEYLWHANYYMWTPKQFIKAYKKYAPEIGLKIEAVVLAAQKKESDKFRELYHELPSISIDYAVTEKMDHKDVLIIRGEFGWSDIGSWDQLYDQMSDETDEQGNLVRGRWVGLDTSSCLIHGHPKKMIATIGISDIVVVDTPDALLVCPKGRAQDVKKIVEQIKLTGREEHL